MPLLLLQLKGFPAEIAATKVGTCLDDRAFFLDFSRPLERLRWFGAWNPWVGVTVSLVVPVVHQAQHVGRASIIVDRGDPYFGELQRLWRQRYPAPRSAPVGRPVAGPQMAADFSAQFPSDVGHKYSGSGLQRQDSHLPPSPGSNLR